jgi:hypothetical protein
MSSPMKHSIIAFEFIRAKPGVIELSFVDANLDTQFVTIPRDPLNNVQMDCVLGPEVFWYPSGIKTNLHINGTEEAVTLHFSYYVPDEWHTYGGVRVRVERKLR